MAGGVKGSVERMVSFSAITLSWYTFPVVVLFACNFLISTFSPAGHWKIKAPDLAAPLLFVGIHELSKDSYDESVIPYFMISILSLGAAAALFQAHYYGEILYKRYFRMFWRLTPLLTFVLYVLFILLDISHYLL